ncbi:MULTISPECIES: hypothetical protein [Pseudomonas]|uniref:Uncharacterized protein n=1 Tax=Pseudomonas fluorescens TaxID=294 RepID=A0A5E7DH71_PSEFL|nr:MULTISPECIES: hypothetical protein [Pseudomonas]QCY15053.1 hypothetical protein ELQ88_32185 [Pseudomonas sp. MPC6]VVO06682.1 hypothetical protein PS710_03114 [Pseudomonas fluorescens]
MIVKSGDVICVASGIFVGYARDGPFVATQDFDLDSFVADAMKPITELWKVSSLLSHIPRMLFESGLISKLPCRKIYLGALGEIDIREEQED